MRKRGQPVEGLSLDEAFVAIGESTFEEARALAATLRREIFDATGLTVSAGVATGKMIAKIASDTCKPDGLLAIAPGEEAAFLEPLPVARLWGIGPKMQTRLSVFGISTIGDLAALDDRRLRELFGSWWHEVRDLARGIDRRPVEPERETKSISTEETFEYDVSDESRLIDVLRDQARELAETLERERTRRADDRREDQARRLHRSSAVRRILPSRRATRVESFAPPCTAYGAPAWKAHRCACSEPASHRLLKATHCKRVYFSLRFHQRAPRCDPHRSERRNPVFYR